MAERFPSLPPRYRLLAPIGEGNMGAVFRAYDRLRGQDVALKQVLLPPGLTPEQTEQELLLLAHEFRTLAGLRHPHIISVLDYGFDAQRRPFFTMELLEGAQSILDAGRRLPLVERVALLVQALEALAYLHRRGILHHDLKPANMLVAGGQVRLLDFGLAVVAHQPRDHDAFGTLQYLAPEVIDGQPYREAADLYSLGVVAYELLVGRHPFEAITALGFFQQIRAQPPDLSPLADEPALAELLGRLLAKAPADRPPSTQAAIGLLRQASGLAEAPGDHAIRESYLQAAAFVGREAELAQLAEALDQAQQGRGSAWLIGGESGVGKSRLLRELATQALVAGVAVIRGQVPQEGGAIFQLWRDALRQLAIISAPIDDLTAGVLLPLVPDLEELLGRPIPPAPAIEGQAAQLRLLTSIAGLFVRQTQPLVLLLEDLQWADESLQPLRYLLRGVAERPLLVIGAYRDDERPGLPDELPAMRLLTLPRLSPAQVAELSAAMLGSLGRQPALVEWLQRETEGNTFFLVEVVRALAEEAGDLSRVRSASLPQQQLAGGIRQVIWRRLGRVPAWAQPALRAAAAIGRQIDAPLLLAIFPDLDEQPWLRACADAAVLEVLSERWQFHHDKLRVELLAQLGPEQLRALHQTIAEAYARRYGAEEDRAAQLAYHWGQAEDHAHELGACRRAIGYAQRQGSLIEAARLLSRALEIAPADERQTLIDLHLQRGEVRIMLTTWAEAEHDFRAALAHAHEPALAAGALLALGRLAQMRNDYSAAMAWLTRAQQIYESQGDLPGLARTLSVVGQAWFLQSAYPQARASLEQGLAYARAAGDAAGIAGVLINLGHLDKRTSEYAQGRAHFDQALAIYQGLNDLQGVAGCQYGLGMIAYNQGSYHQARDLLERSLALRRATGHKASIPGLLNGLANADACLGDSASARARYTEALALAREIDANYDAATVLNNLGSLLSELGDHTAARALLEEALALRRRLRDSYGIVSVLNNLAGVDYYLGNYAAAQHAYAEGVTLAMTIGDRDGVAYNLAGMAIVAAARGDLERATRLAGATEALLEAIDGALSTDMRHDLDQATTRARAALGEPPFQAAWRSGRQLSLEDMVQYGLSG